MYPPFSWLARHAVTSSQRHGQRPHTHKTHRCHTHRFTCNHDRASRTSFSRISLEISAPIGDLSPGTRAPTITIRASSQAIQSNGTENTVFADGFSARSGSRPTDTQWSTREGTDTRGLSRESARTLLTSSSHSVYLTSSVPIFAFCRFLWRRRRRRRRRALCAGPSHVNLHTWR